MLLKSITPRNYGPFLAETTLEVDDRVTILTGPNDVGKSLLLRWIALMCDDTQEGKLVENDVNLDYQAAASTTWANDSTIGGSARFDVTEQSETYVPKLKGAKWQQVDVTFSLVPSVKSRQVTRVLREGSPTQVSGFAIREMPRCICLPRRPDNQVRDVIDLTAPNLPERELLETAFESPYESSRWQNISAPRLANALAKAEDRLTQKLHQFLPEHLGVAFHIRAATGGERNISLHLRDGHGGLTPVGARGAGVRKLLTLLGVLMRIPALDGHVYLLFDEPENSLHADAQHFLRAILEKLADNPLIQVIYATHSPAMINPMRPESLRLLRRVPHKETTTSMIENRPIHASYLPVRASLGISPADSLQFAPVTLIVEGVSEALGLPLLIDKLVRSGAAGFEGAREVFSQVHIWDAAGDHFDKCCGFAKSQLVKPALLLDGDKKKTYEARRAKVDSLAGVPVVFLPDGREFEDLVPRQAYFEALAGVQDEKVALPKEDFEKWEADNCHSDKEMFSKRVGRWLSGKHPSARYDKAAVIRRAIELSEASDVTAEPLTKLVKELRNLLGAT